VKNRGLAALDVGMPAKGINYPSALLHIADIFQGLSTVASINAQNRVMYLPLNLPPALDLLPQLPAVLVGDMPYPLRRPSFFPQAAISYGQHARTQYPLANHSVYSSLTAARILAPCHVILDLVRTAGLR